MDKLTLTKEQEELIESAIDDVHGTDNYLYKSVKSAVIYLLSLQRKELAGKIGKDEYVYDNKFYLSLEQSLKKDGWDWKSIDDLISDHKAIAEIRKALGVGE